MSTVQRSSLALLIAGALAATPAVAQHQGHDMSAMPGMVMPAQKPAPKKAVVKKPAAKAPTVKKRAPKRGTATRATTSATATRAKPARSHAGMDMSGMKQTTTGDAASTGTTSIHSPATSVAPASTPHTHGSGATEVAHDMSSMPGMDMSGMDHSQMDMSEMDHSQMDMSGTGHAAPHDLPAGAPPREPIAAITDADRAAAFPPLAAGHPTHDAMTHSYWLADRLEVRNGGKGGAWEGLAWVGGDVDRLWLRSEGDVEDGGVERGNLEVLYGHGITPWWDVVAGAKHEFGERPSRTYAAIGVQGLAPYKFEVEATAFVGNGGRTAATLEAEYDTLITNRLVLQWQGEANLYGRSDRAIGVGAGLSTIEAGARLRYEITRRFAPYIGVEVERAFGATADLRRESGGDASDTRVVAGIRFWF